MARIARVVLPRMSRRMARNIVLHNKLMDAYWRNDVKALREMARETDRNLPRAETPPPRSPNYSPTTLAAPDNDFE